MIKPPVLCPCGCGKVLPHGELCPYRKKQQLARKKRFDLKRPSARDRGYNHEWRKAREAYLKANPYCKMCADEGRVTTATIVDHITPHKGNDRLFWFVGNWQPLCRFHHNSTKQRMERRK